MFENDLVISKVILNLEKIEEFVVLLLDNRNKSELLIQ